MSSTGGNPARDAILYDKMGTFLERIQAEIKRLEADIEAEKRES